MNTPLQGSAADIIKEAMLTVEFQLEQRRLSSQLLLQIHDELLLEAQQDELSETVKCLRVAMEGVDQLNVPLLIDISTGKNWGEMKPWRI